MVNRRPNIIRKQSVELEFLNETNTIQIQEKIRQICNSDLLVALDSLFEQYAGESEIIRIDKLEIELGTVSSDGFLQAVLEKIKTKLADIALERPTRFNKQSISFQQRTQELFLFFLKHGYFPWWAEDRPLKQLEVEVFPEIDNGFAHQVIKILAKDQIALQRLLWQFSDKFLEKIIYTIQNGNELVPLVNWFESSLTELQQGIPKNQLRDKLWSHLIKWTADSKSEKTETSVFFKELCQMVAQSFHVSLPTIYLQLSGSRKKRAFSQYGLRDQQIAVIDRFLLEEVLKKNLNPLSEKPESKINAQVESDEVNGKEESKTGQSIVPDNPPGQTGDKSEIQTGLESIKNAHFSKTKTEDQVNPDLEIYISGAGLVLLHPFLPALFREFELLLKNEFTDEIARHYGVHLLACLESGKEETPEHHLVLHKLLCGMNIEEPLMRMPEFKQNELEKTEELLQAVVGHWQALKNTSAEGLRQTFLQRSGKLTHKEENWLLQVEQKSYDILLEKLPWGYSTIKLPWMKKILYVEWA